MSDSRLYTRLLLPKGHGYPLFHPQPFDDLPLEARKTGTEIGDVGIITGDGSFDVIFNICRATDDPLNRFGVPEGFEQIRLGLGDIAPKQTFYRPGSDVSNTKITKRRLDIEAGIEGNVFLPLGVGAVVEISTSSRATAILLLPDGAARTNLRRLQAFRDYALKHAQQWYAFVNGDLGRMVDSGELYLVTGVDKSSSWSVAALENSYEGCELSLKLKPVYAGSGSASYAWEWTTASSFANSGPRRGPGEQSWTDNQTVFLRGFKVAIRSTPLKRSSKVSFVFAEVGWTAEVDFRDRTRDLPPGELESLSENSKVGQRGLNSTLLFADARAFQINSHITPADAINAYLLDAFPDAAVAITHDDQWAAVLNEDLELPTEAEMIKRIVGQFNIESTYEGIFLQHMDSATIDEPPSPRTMLGNSNQMIDPSLQKLNRGDSPALPEIERENLRSRVFNPASPASSRNEFEDPAAEATPDAESLENLGDSVLHLVVTSLIAEIYPELRVVPATKLRALLLDDATMDTICAKYKFPNRVGSAKLADRPTHNIFKAFIGAIVLEQGFEMVKPCLDAAFRLYSTSAYNLLRESYGIVPFQQISTVSTSIGPSVSVPASPPSSSSSPGDSSTNHLTLFNERKQKLNRHVDWTYPDHPSVGLDAGGVQDSPPRGNKAKTKMWLAEVIVDGEVLGRGEGSTKKVARNEAAKQALPRL
ncbi:Ribonuclease III [Mycena venus]|uniref:Ribonuclease III n=1 Tax=Mycena venus TaxID=2733690 RepID=A0A8H6X242_9AGAR|nr:Ribonuclease III [Mycena venus]